MLVGAFLFHSSLNRVPAWRWEWAGKVRNKPGTPPQDLGGGGEEVRIWLGRGPPGCPPGLELVWSPRPATSPNPSRPCPLATDVVTSDSQVTRGGDRVLPAGHCLLSTPVLAVGEAERGRPHPHSSVVSGEPAAAGPQLLLDKGHTILSSWLVSGT